MFKMRGFTILCLMGFILAASVSTVVRLMDFPRFNEMEKALIDKKKKISNAVGL